jgi:hypothetical protein
VLKQRRALEEAFWILLPFHMSRTGNIL